MRAQQNRLARHRESVLQGEELPGQPATGGGVRGQQRAKVDQHIVHRPDIAHLVLGVTLEGREEGAELSDDPIGEMEEERVCALTPAVCPGAGEGVRAVGGVAIGQSVGELPAVGVAGARQEALADEVAQGVAGPLACPLTPALSPAGGKGGQAQSRFRRAQSHGGVAQAAQRDEHLAGVFRNEPPTAVVGPAERMALVARLAGPVQRRRADVGEEALNGILRLGELAAGVGQGQRVTAQQRHDLRELRIGAALG